MGVSGGQLAQGIIVDRRRVVVLRQLVIFADQVRSLAHVRQKVGLLVLPYDQTLFLARSEDQGVKQRTERKAVRNPGLVHVQDIPHAQGGHLRIGVRIRGHAFFEILDIDRFGHGFPRHFDPASLIRCLGQFRLDQPLQHTVAENT